MYGGRAAKNRAAPQPVFHHVAKFELLLVNTAFTCNGDKKRSRFLVQTALGSAIRFNGVALHSGRHARMVIHPAADGVGIRFRRTDIVGCDPEVPAHWSAIVPARLSTRVANADGVEVGTIEHVMAALAGCGVHNALIEIDGPELPILDGSAAPFVVKIRACGVVALDAPLEVLRVTRPVQLVEGDAMARLEPAPGFSMRFEIDFADSAIGRQVRALDLANGAFAHMLADSRTFCRRSDVDAMRAQGLARGGSFYNAVVVEDDAVLSPGGLRHPDEPVRHKMLDAVGDLALAGAPLMGRYVARKAGHALTGRLVAALFETGAVERLTLDAAAADWLPGIGRGRTDIPLSA